jgi:hypothetical protein
MTDDLDPEPLLEYARLIHEAHERLADGELNTPTLAVFKLQMKPRVTQYVEPNDPRRPRG